MMSSPFPHMHARAAQGAAAKIAKKNEAWELFRTGCWRAGILIVCTLAATLVYQLVVARQEGRLHFNWERAAPSIVRRDVPVPVQGKFFIDISRTSDSLENSVNGRHLEKKGWNGVCIVPLPIDIPSRTCKVVAVPVGPKDGEQIRVSDCSRNTMGLQGLMNMFMKVGCEQVPVITVSIEKVLAIASAPKVIDYISLDTKANATDIVRSFPFGEHCARAWSIKTMDSGDVSEITNLLEVAQGCRVHKGDHIWARCPCEKRARATAINTPLATIEISASGNGKHRKAPAKLTVDTSQ